MNLCPYGPPKEEECEPWETLYATGNTGAEGGTRLRIERQPGYVTDPMVVSFRKWNGRRSLLNQTARWTGTGWDPKRWTPKPPIIPAHVLDLVERRMRQVAE
jgi:hypothetical protein